MSEFLNHPTVPLCCCLKLSGLNLTAVPVPLARLGQVFGFILVFSNWDWGTGQAGWGVWELLSGEVLHNEALLEAEEGTLVFLARILGYLMENPLDRDLL